MFDDEKHEVLCECGVIPIVISTDDRVPDM